MDGYQVLEVGSPDEWLDRGKQFVDKEMETQFIGLSVNALAPGGESKFWHRHGVLEEIYLFLQGTGQMGLDDEVIEVHAGSTVRISNDVWRVLRADPNSTEELRWVCIRSGGDKLGSISPDGEKDLERARPW